MERYEIWIFIFMLGLLGFNWPFLEIFYSETFRYLFSFWLIFIAIIAFAAYKSKKDIGKNLK